MSMQQQSAMDTQQQAQATHAAARNLTHFKTSLHIEAEPRKKTKGEHIFNFATYGGITWILNEVISAWAGGKIQNEVKDPNTREVVQKAGKYNAWFKDKIVGFKGLLNIPKDKYPRLIDRPIKILYLCIGGTAVVPLVQWMEDRKGKIVRALNGNAPELAEAHEEMDLAPSRHGLVGKRASLSYGNSHWP